jgi:hypothetical protein
MLMICDFCGKDYETVNGLDKHRLTAHGAGRDEERIKHDCPYCVCEVCGKTVEKDLKKHRGECIFCPFCDYKNLKKARLLKHIENTHTRRKNKVQTKAMDLTSKIGLSSILDNKMYWKI